MVRMIPKWKSVFRSGSERALVQLRPGLLELIDNLLRLRAARLGFGEPLEVRIDGAPELLDFELGFDEHLPPSGIGSQVQQLLATIPESQARDSREYPSNMNPASRSRPPDLA